MKTIFRLGILCLLLSSCRDEFQFVLPAEPGLKYNIEGELTPGGVVDVRLTENVTIGSSLDDIDLMDAEILFMGRDVPGGQLPMVYQPETERYQLVRQDFRVTEGSEYTLMAMIDNETRDTIVASTLIPFAVGFKAQFVDSRKVILDSLFSHQEIELELTIDEPTTRPAYFRFMPFRLESVVMVNNGGVDVIDFGTKTELEVVSVTSGANAVDIFDHVDGIIIDESRLNQSSLRLILRTVKPLRDGVAVLPESGRDLISRLHLELFTISQEIYEYDRLVDQFNRGQGSNASAAVPNISNATGVFGGSSRRIIFLDI